MGRPLESFLPKPQGGLQLTDIAQATIRENVRMSRREWSQTLFHLTLTLPTTSPPSQSLYRAGDVLVVYPPNPTEIVDLALSLFSGSSQTIRTTSASSCESGAAPGSEQIVLDQFTEFEIKKVATTFSRKNRLESGLTCSLRDLFSLYLDIAAVPQRSFFEQLSFHATNPEEAEKLLELSSGEGVDLYQQYCAKERRGYIEVLSEFKSCHGIPLERLIELVPPLPPRYYSIASSGLGSNPSEVQLCIALVEYLTPLKRKRYGLCSKFLSEIAVGSSITCCIRKGSFPTPNSSDPLVLIGPGTGLAPMRAFVHERYPEFSQLTSSLPPPPVVAPFPPPFFPPHPAAIGTTILFYGCRSEEDDFLYRHEWQALSAYSSQHGLPVTIKVAFSRKGTNSGRYVTHDLRDQGPLLWNLIQQVVPPLPPSPSPSDRLTRESMSPGQLQPRCLQMCGSVSLTSSLPTDLLEEREGDWGGRRRRGGCSKWRERRDIASRLGPEVISLRAELLSFLFLHCAPSRHDRTCEETGFTPSYSSALPPSSIRWVSTHQTQTHLLLIRNRLPPPLRQNPGRSF
jgi:sulfite reductase alpha subunit-like flavoprotein